MNIEKVIASLKDCTTDELNRLNKAIKRAQAEQHMANYDQITRHLENELEMLGKAGYGLKVQDGYENTVLLYPSELTQSYPIVTPYHCTDKRLLKDLDIELPYEDDHWDEEKKEEDY